MLIWHHLSFWGSKSRQNPHHKSKYDVRYMQNSCTWNAVWDWSGFVKGWGFKSRSGLNFLVVLSLLLTSSVQNWQSRQSWTQVRNSLLQMGHLLEFTESSYHSYFFKLPPRDAICRRQISVNAFEQDSWNWVGIMRYLRFPLSVHEGI